MNMSSKDYSFSYTRLRQKILQSFRHIPTTHCKCKLYIQNRSLFFCVDSIFSFRKSFRRYCIRYIFTIRFLEARLLLFCYVLFWFQWLDLDVSIKQIFQLIQFCYIRWALNRRRNGVVASECLILHCRILTTFRTL